MPPLARATSRAAACLLLSALMATAGTAAQFADQGDKARVNHSSRLQSLSEDIVATTCRIAEGVATEAGDAATVIATYRGLFAKAETITAQITGVYSDPEHLFQIDAITLNILGRQQTLAARLARTTCGVAAGDDAVGSWRRPGS